MRRLLLCASLLAAAAPAVPAPQVNRTVRATVTTGKGEPVPNLTPADFEVKEDGKAREVLRVEPSADPLSIALLLDDRRRS
jgi:hypothetical protein